MTNAQGNQLTEKQLWQYEVVKSKDLEAKRNSFHILSAAKIATYAATLEFKSGKNKNKWPYQHPRPFICFCKMPVNVGTVLRQRVSASRIFHIHMSVVTTNTLSTQTTAPKPVYSMLTAFDRNLCQRRSKDYFKWYTTKH